MFSRFAFQFTRRHRALAASVSLLWAVSASGEPATGRWREFAPPARGYSATVLDPVRGRMLVIGGYDLQYHSDVWSLPLSGASSLAWVKLDSLGSGPSGRFGHTAIYDPVRDRIVFFGGDSYTQVVNNDVWVLPLGGGGGWTQLQPGGTPPSKRAFQTAIYDPVRDRMLVYGGYDDFNPVGELWELTLGANPAWSQLQIEGAAPLPRYGHGAIYDPVRDRMVIFGGWAGFNGGRLNDVWSLSLTGPPQWTELTPPGLSPEVRSDFTLTYDPVRDRAVMVGGFDGGPFFNDSWSLSLSASPSWLPLAPQGAPPAPRVGHAAIYDPGSDRLIVYGGYKEVSTYCSDVWSLSLGGSGQWSELSPLPPPPPGRYRACAMQDVSGGRMLVFGGRAGTLDDLWELPTNSAAPGWRALAPSGGPPPARIGASVVYDSLRARAIVFGGTNATGSLNDLWELTLGPEPRWSVLEPVGAPPAARDGHTAIADPARDRMIVFGGVDAGGNFLSDVWELSLGAGMAWRKLQISGATPVGRSLHVAIDDPIGERMLVFGGDNGTALGDLWALSLSGAPVWSRLEIPGAAPSARSLHSAVYDPARHRMVVFGGLVPTPPYLLNDVWTLSLGDAVAWTELTATAALPIGRRGHAALFDAAHDRMLVFGGGEFYFVLNDTWALELSGAGGSAAVDCGPCRRPGLTLGPIVPNPTAGALTIRFVVPDPQPARLTIFDVSGRVVCTLIDARVDAGPHAISWNRQSASGRRVPPGLYLCELRTRANRLARRLVILE